jgi:hypothetical protein
MIRPPVIADLEAKGEKENYGSLSTLPGPRAIRHGEDWLARE